MATAITVPFHGSNLFVVEHNEQPYTPMKFIVEGMGLDWRSQQRKLSSNTERWGMVKMTIPTNGDLQEMNCLPLRKLFGWLQTISPNKVRDSIRDTVIQYQNECDDVLWQYWTKQQQTTTLPSALTPALECQFKLPELPFDEINEDNAGQVYNYLVRYFSTRTSSEDYVAGKLVEALYKRQVQTSSALREMKFFIDAVGLKGKTISH